ncbi:MAG TPA: Crp/Fnr family transcriptional regulator [Prolixibacteraceae bacterium]|nr:Crp/Fnr family transcriptional regulator [Prolixibacteraceae bacterium]
MLKYELITRCPVFTGMTENEIKNLLQTVHFQVKQFSKNDLLAVAGEPVQFLYILLEGSVKGEMIDFSGKVIKIEDIEAPKPIAAAFLFGKENMFPVTVTANNDVKLLSVPIDSFLKLLQSNSQMLKNYLDSISTRAQFLSQKLQFISFKTIRKKIAHFLLNKAGSQLHSVDLKMTQQQLADLFAVSRPSLARVLGEMQKEGLIRLEKKTVILLEKNKLQKIVRNA